MRGRYNCEFKESVKAAGLTLCDLGYAANISETTIFRWLRYPLSQENEKKLKNVLEKLTMDKVKI